MSELNFSDLVGVCNTARVWLADSEYGEYLWWVVAGLAAVVAAVKVTLWSWRGAKATTLAAARAWGWYWRGSQSDLCREVLAAVEEPGAMWDGGKGDLVCANGMQVSLLGGRLNHAWAGPTDCLRDLTIGERDAVLKAAQKAATNCEAEEAEARRAASLEAVRKMRERGVVKEDKAKQPSQVAQVAQKARA